MRDESTPSATSALRTARARDSERRRAVEGSSGVPAAYATTLKLVLPPLGADPTTFLMAAALAGLRLASPAPKVTRRPEPVLVAALAALSEIGGGGGGPTCATCGAVVTGAGAAVGGGAVGSVAGGGVAVAGGAAVGAGEAVATFCVAAGASVAGSGVGFADVVVAPRR